MTEQARANYRAYQRERLAQLSEEARAARREYRREWQRQNRDKCREYQRRYWEKRAQRETEAGNGES